MKCMAKPAELRFIIERFRRHYRQILH